MGWATTCSRTWRPSTRSRRWRPRGRRAGAVRPLPRHPGAQGAAGRGLERAHRGRRLDRRRPRHVRDRLPDVFAVGDITSAPVPRAGVIAEGEAGTVADVLLHRLGGGPSFGALPRPRPVLHGDGRWHGLRGRAVHRAGRADGGLQPAVDGARRGEGRVARRRRRWFG